MVAVVAERVIEGEGTAEAAWQAWLPTDCAASAAWPAWLPPTARMVVVAPHPDDELLACGGLLAMHAARGSDCLVVAVTDGEASHGQSVQWPAERLAIARRAERVEGLARLGLGSAVVVRLGLPDGRVARHVELLAYRLRLLLRPGDVVISTWRLDGHPDHDATGLAAAQACAAAGCRFVEAPVWMWHWAAPGDERVPWPRLHGVTLAPTAWSRKQAAMAAHVSQLGPRHADEGPVLGPAIVARAGRTAEYFFV